MRFEYNFGNITHYLADKFEIVVIHFIEQTGTRTNRWLVFYQDSS